MKFTSDFLQEILYSFHDDRFVSDTIIEHSRWSIHHWMVFEHEGKYYGAAYSVGATESQEESPWEYEDEVECEELVPVEKTITAYEPVSENSQASLYEPYESIIAELLDACELALRVINDNDVYTYNTITSAVERAKKWV